MKSPDELVAQILEIRGLRVIVDAHLARLYGVTTKRLNEQVRRNAARFPREFAFVLTRDEATLLKPHFAASSWGGKRKPPLVFTEHGALMAAGVLNSRRAIEMSVFVVRAFIHMRDAMRSHREIGRRLDQLERRVGNHDAAIREILEALRRLTAPPAQPRRRIGFVQDD
jgi:ORF6N domain